MGSVEQPSMKVEKPSFSSEANSLEYAQSLDAKDHMRKFRDQFIIPSKANIKATKLAKPGLSDDSSIYFCGNSLGLQPKCVKEYLQAHLDTWSSIGVHGHFRDLEDSPLTQWQLLAEHASKQSAPIVGALPSEVAIMGTLTMNLHLLMASFYTPTPEKNKIILEWKAFPSDHYAIESQIRGHGYDPASSMVMIGPDEGTYEISTEKILRTIDEHADTTALLLLPGIQYYTGQFFDIKTITAYAQSKGLLVGWDLAHAAGNVPLELHDWNVDFAVWCTYKYMNAGPGSIAGMYVHERHGQVDYSEGEDKPKYRHRLMEFRPSPGASGYQVSNPSVVDLTSLCAALSIFNQTSMSEIRRKSLHLTAYLEHLLLSSKSSAFQIITPSDPAARGTQLSVLLKPGRLETLSDMLEEAGIVADKRKPDVIRVAPVPLYNTYEDVWRFVQIFEQALEKCDKA
ncbi:putative Kynureninase protein [Rutstroemia sp. NJR-2017a WRK4]|nr:putative Kynureninase protein [Rutstroemia sp. NJR-2017a WRK4]